MRIAVVGPRPPLGEEVNLMAAPGPCARLVYRERQPEVVTAAPTLGAIEVQVHRQSKAQGGKDWKRRTTGNGPFAASKKAPAIGGPGLRMAEAGVRWIEGARPAGMSVSAQKRTPTVTFHVRGSP